MIVTTFTPGELVWIQTLVNYRSHSIHKYKTCLFGTLFKKVNLCSLAKGMYWEVVTEEIILDIQMVMFHILVILDCTDSGYAGNTAVGR